MKRKAMLMGMAVMTSMPGWATASGTGKSASAAHPYSHGMEAGVTVDKVEFEYVTHGSSKAGTAETSPAKAAEFLAQLKYMLSNVSYGMPNQPTIDKPGWKLEMLESNALSNDGGDPRLQQAKPVGVAFRLAF